MSSRSWLEEEPAHSLSFAQIKPEPTAIPDAAPEPAPLPARPPDPGRAEREVAYWQNRHQQARKGGEPWTRTYKASLRGFELFLTLYRLADGTLWGLYWVRTSQSQGTARQWPLRGKLLQDGSFHLEGTANSAKFHGRYNPDNTLSVGEFRRVRGERDSEENGETDDVVLEGLRLEPLTPMEPFRSLPSWAQGQEGEETAGTATTAPQAQPQAQPQQPKEETAPPAPQPRQPQPSPPPQPQPGQQAPQPPQASAGKAWSERHSFEGKLSAGNANVTIHFSEVFKKADGTLLGNFSTPSGNGHFFGTLEADGTVEFTAKYDTGKFQGQTRQFRNGRLSFSPGGKPKTLEGEWLGKDEGGKDTIYRLTAVWVPNSGITINTQMIEEINNASRSDRTSGYKSPYWGKQIGSLDGIPVYYNARDEGNNNRRNKLKDSNGKVIYDFGLKWQCVEFIRRYFYYKHGFLFEGRGDAHSYFSDEVKDGGNHRELRQYMNDHGYDRRVGKFTGKGSVSKPQKGDLIVMHYSTTGHVAIIGEVSDDHVTIVQQNVETDVTERFPLEKVFAGGEVRWRINSTRVRGWLRP